MHNFDFFAEGPRRRKARNTIPTIVFVSRDAARSDRVVAALSKEAAAVVSVMESRDLGRSTVAPAAVIVDAVAKTRHQIHEVLARVEQEIGGCPCVVYTDTRASSAGLRDAYKLGALAVTFVSEEEYPAIPYRAVAEAQALHVARVVQAVIRHPRTREIAFAVISKACSGMSVPDLVAALATDYKKLRRELARLRLPNPHDLIVCGRLLFAAWVLERRWRGVAQLAADLGWQDDVPLESAVARWLNCTPSALRSSGSFERVRAVLIRTFVTQPADATG
jgi:AraC-like DNA-binding protein